MARLPRLPEDFFSVLGQLPVRETNTPESDNALGVTRFRRRSIDVDEGSDRESQWQTMWHEATHVGLWDSGATDALSHKQEELVCNAMGTYLTAMMKAGYLKVTKPKST